MAHYENFPVGSWLIPARLRPAIAAIYWFARSADDLADEGCASEAQRLEQLQNFVDRFDQALAGELPTDAPDAESFANLARVIVEHHLPTAHFYALISAFRQDVHLKRYPDQAALLDYCNRSANPVGRLVLTLFGQLTPAHQEASDCICTALQLINFWQDVAIDAAKGRIYTPLETLKAFQIDEQDYLKGQAPSSNWQALMSHQVNDTRAMLRSGAGLAQVLPGRLGWEIRMVVQGGQRMLEKIEQVQFDVFNRRPVLQPLDWALMAWRSLVMQ